MDTKYAWSYQCSICSAIVIVERVSEHVADEKAKPDWPGYMSWARVSNG